MQTLYFDKLISEHYANLEYIGVPGEAPLAQSSRQQPGDRDPNTMCAICYVNKMAKGFTECAHKVCPPLFREACRCCDHYRRFLPTVSSRHPKDVDKDETSRRLEDLFPQGAHTYHREIPPGHWVGQTQLQYVYYATPRPEAPVRDSSISRP
ncbi:hypothetical protein L211DRAFT_336051 [Terfezia boudieri ATCC MYA-4762]|uniref:Uncharacterized protein n=1 Tax=Terfezia boudieri ATCC MYA-4762 TaxID=1051890 RepID=A0A3N4LHK0_9PEZI|nr:hypothetical protein L211DRAFT_336051 [Terfezia boudieri ATCC MYA-4762]